MRNIVVPTDFSENSKSALSFAINIANHFGSTIHLINIFEVRTRAGMLTSVRDFMRKDAELNLSEMVRDAKRRLIHGTALEAKAIEGYTVDTVCNYAKSVNAGLIVMGTQGASGLKEIFVGSNTAGVIRKSEVPVMAIPNGYQYRPFKDITLALDEQIVSTSEILKPLTEIARAYKAKIKVVHVEAPEEVSATMDTGVDIFLEGIDHSFHTIRDEEIKEGLDRFVSRNHSDLLCMIRRERSFIGRLFHSSATRREVFDSKVPLLILYD